MEKVEYSEDFKFFLENQVNVINSHNGTLICSRLEARTFYESSEKNMDDEQLDPILKGIHNNLMESNRILNEIQTDLMKDIEKFKM